MLLLVTLLTFFVAMGLSVSAIYFFIEVPAAKKRLQARLQAIQQGDAYAEVDFEADLLRQEVFSQIPWLNRALMTFPAARALRHFMDQSAVKMSTSRLLLISLALGLAFLFPAVLISLPIYLSALLAAAGCAMPFLVLGIKRARRFSRFSELFPDALDLLARAVRAGHAFTTALELIAKELPEPVAGEFRMIYDQQNLGLPMREALQNFAERIPMSDVRIFVTALHIQRDSGGNLAEILDNLAYVIRERFKLMRQVKVYTAEGRLSLYILTAAPPVTALLMLITDPDYLKPLVTDPMGHKMVAGAVIMQIVGYLVIKKITTLKV